LFVCFRILNVARRIRAKQKDHLRERGFLFSFFISFFLKELFFFFFGIYHGDHYSKLQIDLSL
jgi:hypothetical protein